MTESDPIKKIREDHFNSCLMCGKNTISNEEIKHGLCLDCMAILIENIDNYPQRDYPVFIDFAYNVLNKIRSGENPKNVLKNAPEGFGEWLINNHMKTGFGIKTSDIL